MKYDVCRTCTAMKAAAYCGKSFVASQCQQYGCKYNKYIDDNKNDSDLEYHKHYSIQMTAHKTMISYGN